MAFFFFLYHLKDYFIELFLLYIIPSLFHHTEFCYFYFYRNALHLLKTTSTLHHGIDIKRFSYYNTHMPFNIHTSFCMIFVLLLNCKDAC